jgi:hypothetical protein
MKIFIFGQSGSGKTPFAEMVAQQLGVKFISASEWLKPITQDKVFLTKQEHIDGLTAISINELRKNPDACVDYIRKTHDLTQPLIIEGVRNPRDFMNLADFQRDAFVFLNRKPNPYRPSTFDRGVVVISDYVHWLVANGLTDKEKRVNFIYEIEELGDVVDNFVKFFQHKGWCLTCGDLGCEHQRPGAGESGT